MGIIYWQNKDNILLLPEKRKSYKKYFLKKKLIKLILLNLIKKLH